jgi:DNA-binding transcriptional LysR family regulator
VPEDLNIEFLFSDPLVVAVGVHRRCANRRKVAFSELVNEAWLFVRTDSWNYICMAEAFQARGLKMPKISLWSNIASLRNHMMAKGQFVTAVSKSTAEWNGMKLLPVDLPVQPWPVVIATLKNRTLSPVVELFIQFVRDFTAPMRAGENASPGARAGHR